MDQTYDYNAHASSGSAVGGIIVGLIYLAVIVFLIASMWKIFTKAGQPGWAAIVPIYNFYVLTQIVGRPAWWIVLFFIPFVNYIALLIIAIDMAKSFGKGAGFGIGLWLLAPIFYPILGFGSAQYVGPSASGGSAPARA